MDIRLLFPNQYLGAADLTGKDVTLTIARLQVDDLRTNRGAEKKPVLYFREMQSRPKDKQKTLVLNKTNAKTIAKLYGTETNEWQGKAITLYPTTCEAFGEEVDCIRIRAEVPRAAKGRRAPDTAPNLDAEPDLDSPDEWDETAP